MDILGLDLNEFITIVISCAALFISIWDRVRNKVENKKSQQKAEEAIRLSQGITEIELRNSISSARSKINEFGFQLKIYKSEHKNEDTSSLEKIFSSILEDYFNHYDRGCRLYLENKIDRKSFKNEYKQEIKNNVENKNHKEYFHTKKKRYKAILKVYKEWFEK